MFTSKTFLAGSLAITVVAAAFAEPPRTDRDGEPLPGGAIARLGTLHWRHGTTVSLVVFIDNGKRVLSSGGDGIFHVWDAASGKEIRRFGEVIRMDPGAPRVGRGGVILGRYDSVGTLNAAVSDDGKTLATSMPDGKIHIWDVAGGKELRSFEHGHPAYPVAMTFTADGKTLVSRGGQDQKIKVWGLVSEQPNLEISEQTSSRSVYYGGSLNPVAVSPDGKLAAGGAIDFDNNSYSLALKVWDLKEGKEGQKFPEGGGRAFLSTGIWPAFSPDSKNVAWARVEGSIQIQGAVSGKEVQKLDEDNAERRPVRVLFSPDGTKLAAFRPDQTISVFDLGSGKKLRELGEPLADGRSRLLPRGLRGSYLYLTPAALAWSPDGKTLAQGWGNLVRLWNVETGTGNELAGGHTGEIAGVLPLANGKSALTVGTDRTLRRWDLATGKEQSKLDLPSDSPGAALVSATRALVEGADGSAHVWDIDAGKELFKIDGANGVGGAGGGLPPVIFVRGMQQSAVSADGRVLVTTVADQTVRVISLETGKDLGEIKDLQRMVNNPRIRMIRGLCSSPDGSAVAALIYGQELSGPPGGMLQNTVKYLIRLYDTESGNVVWEADTRSPFAQGLSASPDGHNLAYLDGTNVMVLESATGKERCRFNYAASVLSFSSDGQFLALAALQGGDVKVMDLRTGKEIADFHGLQGRVRSLCFGPDTNTLLAGGTDGTVLVWSTAEQVKQARQPVEVSAEAAGQLWTDLGDADPAKAYRAVATLCAAPKGSIALLKEQLKPVKGEKAQRIDKLIADLDDDEFDVRKSAFEELCTLGAQARPALKKALDGNPSTEVRKQAEELLDRLHPSYVTLTAEMLREVRAIEVLETIATSDSRTLLEALSKGAAGNRLTDEAAAALKRLGTTK